MDKPDYVYVTYIATTPEKVWQALTDGEFTKLYWGRARNVSDWKAGSRWEHQDYDEAGDIKVAGEVVESTPPRRLVLTWAEGRRSPEPTRTSRVTFDIEPFMDAVRLTVTHDEVASDPETFKGISAGWPAVLSSLKTLLETGQPLAMTTRRWGGRSE